MSDNSVVPSTLGETIKRSITIRNQRGLHARAASRFVEVANTFDAGISVSRAGQTVSGSSILGLMMLAAAQGTEIELTVIGPEAEQAVNALCVLIETKFDEE